MKIRHLALALFLLNPSWLAAQSVPPCVPDPNLVPLFPITPEPGCQCQDNQGNTIPCASIIVPPNMGNCQCPPGGNAHFWQSKCLRFYTDIDQDGYLELLDTDAKVPFAKSLSDPETRWYFADLITPEVSLLSSPYYPCEGEGLSCQESGTTLRLGKTANVSNMNSVLWSGQVKWTDFSAQATGQIQYSSFLSYLPSFPCVKIPRTLAPGKHKVARKFGKNTYCSGSNCAGTIVPTDSLHYVTLNLAIQGVTAPRIYDFNIQSDAAVAIAEGGPASAKFRLINYGYENIQKSYVVVYLSKSPNVLADPNKIAIGAAQVLNNGQLHLLDAASPLSGMLNQQGVIDAGDSNQSDHVYSLPLTIPENVVTLTPGEKQEIYFSAKTYVVQAQHDAPEYYPPFEAEKDKITVTPDVEIVKVTFLSSTSTEFPPEICYGDKIKMEVEWRTKGPVPTSPDTQLTFLVSKLSNGNAAKTLSDSTINLGSLPGNSSGKEVYEITLWPEPGFKMNKDYWLKVKIVKAGISPADEPKKANNDTPPGQLIPFKLFCPFTPFGLEVDIDHDGSFNEDPALKTYAPGLLISLNSNDDNQDGILDKNGPFWANDPDHAPLNVLMNQCKNAAGNWSLAYEGDRIRIYNEYGQYIPPNTWQPCTGQLEVIPLWIEGIAVSPQEADPNATDAYIRLYFDTDQTTPLLIDQMIYTVFHLDVSADSNNDGQIAAADESCEDVAGRLPQLIWFNTDDDDFDGVEDYLDAELSGLEDNLVPVTIALKPEGLAQTLMEHEYSVFGMKAHIPVLDPPTIAVWKSAQKSPSGAAVTSGDSIPLSALPVQYFVEGIHWTKDVASLEVRLLDDDVVIGKEKTRFYPTQPGVEIVDEIWAGDDLPVTVMGFPPGTPVTMKIFRNGSQVGQVQKTVGALLSAVTKVDLDYDHAHVDHDKPGDRYKIKAIVDDGGCNHFEWDSIECVVKPGQPSGHEGGMELVSASQGIADSNQLIPVAVRVKDDFGNLVADGTPVNFSIISADGAAIAESSPEKYNALTENGIATGYIHSPKTDIVDLHVQAQSGEAKTTIIFEMDWVSGELEPALATYTDGSIDYSAIASISKGQPLTVRLINTNASNGTQVFWTISGYWGADQDTKKTRVTYVEDGESVLQIADTAELLDGLCTITATYSGRFLYTAVYVLPTNLTDPILKIDRPLLDGEKIVNEPFTIQWLIEKPETWPSTYPEQILWTLASGIDYAGTKAYLANLAPNHRYLLHTENPQEQSLLAIFQQPGDAGYIEGAPGIGTNAQGVSSFSIVSRGEFTAANYPADFAPAALGVRQLNFTLADINDTPPLQPLARASIKLARTDTCQRVLGVTGACLGGDPETIEEIATSIGFGLLPVVGVFQDTGALAKNVASMIGLRGQDANKLETTLAMVGVATMMFPSPDDAVRALMKLAKEIEATSPEFALALTRAAEKIVNQDIDALTLAQAGKLIEALADDVEFFAAALKGVRSSEQLTSLTKLLDKFGEAWKDSVKEQNAIDDFTPEALSRVGEFLLRLSPKAQESIDSDNIEFATLVLNKSFDLTFVMPGAADDVVEILKHDELFFPSVIDGFATNIEHADFIHRCVPKLDPAVTQYMAGAIRRLKEEPTLANVYRVDAASFLFSLSSLQTPLAYTSVNGSWARVRWLDALSGPAAFANLQASVMTNGLVPYYRHSVIIDSVFTPNPESYDWGKVLGPMIVRDFVSKVTSDGLHTVRFVVPDLMQISKAVTDTVEEIKKSQNIVVQFVVIPFG